MSTQEGIQKLDKATETNAEGLASVFGVSGRRVRQWVEEGIVKRAGPNRFNLSQCAQAYVGHISNASDGVPDDLDEEQKKEFAKEKLRKLKLEADKLEFEKNEREKVWAPAHEFEEAFAQRLIGIREAMETALDDLKMQIPNISASKSDELDNMLADAFNSIIE